MKKFDESVTLLQKTFHHNHRADRSMQSLIMTVRQHKKLSFNLCVSMDSIMSWRAKWVRCETWSLFRFQHSLSSSWGISCIDLCSRRTSSSSLIRHIFDRLEWRNRCRFHQSFNLWIEDILKIQKLICNEKLYLVYQLFVCLFWITSSAREQRTGPLLRGR